MKKFEPTPANKVPKGTIVMCYDVPGATPKIGILTDSDTLVCFNGEFWFLNGDTKVIVIAKFSGHVRDFLKEMNGDNRPEYTKIKAKHKGFRWS